MTYNESIAHADKIRPNSIDQDLKYAWIAEVDAKIAEPLGIETENPYPNDATLSVPFPYDNIYELYLIAMIDLYNQDTSLYQADYALFNNALDEARSHLIRVRDPEEGSMWKVM